LQAFIPFCYAQIARLFRGPAGKQLTKLDDAALDFAKAHIEHFYDSDFFPKPVVYDVIFSDWDTIKSNLTKVDVLQLPTQQPRASLPPRSRGATG
jgi:hypothetical protein